jgi:hypothetical protein
MSDGTFFVNSDGLDTGKDGFHEKGNQIQDLALRINDLMNPARVAAAAGNDQNGRTFAQQHLAAAAKVHDGISSWGEVVSGTTDAIGAMANSFRRTDEVVTDAGTQLGKSLLELNTEIDNALSGNGSGGGGGGDNSSSGSGTTRTPATGTNLTTRVPSVPATDGLKNPTVHPNSSLVGTAGDPVTPALSSVEPRLSAVTPGISAGELLPQTVGERVTPLTPQSPGHIIPREPSVPPKGDHS